MQCVTACEAHAVRVWRTDAWGAMVPQGCPAGEPQGHVFKSIPTSSNGALM